MIIAFRSESSLVLERFLKHFIEPESVFTQIVHSIAYTSKDVRRVGDVVIIRTISIVDITAKYLMITMALLFLVGYIFNFHFLLMFGAIFMVTCMFIVSRSVRSILFLWELRRGGHKFKVQFLSLSDVVDVLLVE